ncbi:MAG: glycosyltransferase [Chloroflexota bacterium]
MVAADLPGFRSVVGEVGCGELVDPTSPAAIAAGIGRLLDLVLFLEGLRAVGDRGLAAAHDRYNWGDPGRGARGHLRRAADARRQPVTAERPAARVGILSPGTSEFDSRAHRIARSLVARGDTVTIYSRRRPGLPAEETVDGYRVVRMPLSTADAAALRQGSGGGRPRRPPSAVGRATMLARRGLGAARTLLVRWSDRIPVIHRFRIFPMRPREWAVWFERGVEPHDIWHGMWAPSLPALERVRARHGGATLYDPRDVYLRSRIFGPMPGWQRSLLTWFERRWARAADAVIQVSEPYAEMTARDLGLPPLPIVRNCPDRWEPPVPRPDRIRELLGLPASTRIVLYQGLLVVDRGIEQAMEAIREVPDAVLVLMGFGNLEAHYRALSAEPGMRRRAHVIDAVPPQSLSVLSRPRPTSWSVMPYQPSTENHESAHALQACGRRCPGGRAGGGERPARPVGRPGRRLRALVDLTTRAASRVWHPVAAGPGPEGLRAMGDRGSRPRTRRTTGRPSSRCSTGSTHACSRVAPDPVDQAGRAGRAWSGRPDRSASLAATGSVVVSALAALTQTHRMPVREQGSTS